MEGLLVMADISGYTKFVAGTEAEHSREILAELMDGIAKSFGGRLAIDQVEGDALACTTERTDVEVVDWLRETFRLFHGRLRDIRTADHVSVPRLRDGAGPRPQVHPPSGRVLTL